MSHPDAGIFIALFDGLLGLGCLAFGKRGAGIFLITLSAAIALLNWN